MRETTEPGTKPKGLQSWVCVVFYTRAESPIPQVTSENAGTSGVGPSALRLPLPIYPDTTLGISRKKIGG
jgi:hypothetical protein